MDRQGQRVLLLGASGRVGRRIIAQGVARGHRFTAVTQAKTIGADGERVRVADGSPRDAGLLLRELPGHDAVVIALGPSRAGRDTVISDTARALLPAMRVCGVGRLIAVTGVSAGWLHRLFAGRRADEAGAEALIAASGLAWTMVRAARGADDEAAQAVLDALEAGASV